MYNLVVYLENRPGSLAEMAEALGEAGVNIEGFMAHSACEDVNILVKDAQAARTALEAAGIQIGPAQEANIHSLKNVPGALGALARDYADEGINIEYGYIDMSGNVVIVAG